MSASHCKRSLKHHHSTARACGTSAQVAQLFYSDLQPESVQEQRQGSGPETWLPAVSIGFNSNSLTCTVAKSGAGFNNNCLTRTVSKPVAKTFTHPGTDQDDSSGLHVGTGISPTEQPGRPLLPPEDDAGKKLKPDTAAGLDGWRAQELQAILPPSFGPWRCCAKPLSRGPPGRTARNRCWHRGSSKRGPSMPPTSGLWLTPLFPSAFGRPPKSGEPRTRSEASAWYERPCASARP